MASHESIRNVAIIAHVDHGKTSLVDRLLKCAEVFSEHQTVAERVMDRHDLERERGITIFSKNCAVDWKGVRINLIDTPGHADFGGEVERVLRMADGALILACAFEGPMPQTRFVLRKALLHDLSLLCVVNKVDRKDARPEEARDELLELLIDLDAGDDVLETPVIFASAKEGRAGLTLEEFNEATDVASILDAIIEHVPPPRCEPDGAFQMAVAQIDYDKFLGRIAVGKIRRGAIKIGAALRCPWGEDHRQVELKKLFGFQGISRVEVDEVRAGDIAAVSGIEGIEIGDTICALGAPEPLEPVEIDAPTVSMRFSATDSPFRGLEGDYVTSRQLRDRLFREAKQNVALRVSETELPDEFEVAGRGVLHLGILVEEMRRQGYEFQVAQPRVLEQESEDGTRLEPIEICVIDVLEKYSGKAIEILGQRRGELRTVRQHSGMTRLEFEIPSRGLIGVRTRLLNATCGEASLHHQFLKYDSYRGAVPQRLMGVQIAHETGRTTSFALDGLDARGPLFVAPGAEVYAGQVVGEHCRDNDIEVNVCRKKHLTNIRAGQADRKLVIAPPRIFNVEESLEYIGPDELVEFTPKAIRMRKRQLDHKKRKRESRKQLA